MQKTNFDYPQCSCVVSFWVSKKSILKNLIIIPGSKKGSLEVLLAILRSWTDRSSRIFLGPVLKDLRSVGTLVLADVRTLITDFMTDDQTRHSWQLVGASPKIKVGRKIVIPFNYWLELAAKVHPIKSSGPKFFIMSTEFYKNISDWSYDCTDHKNDIDFFMRLVKWPKIDVKKCQNLIFKVDFQHQKSFRSF